MRKVTDEITGLTVRSRPEFIVLDSAGLGVSIYPSFNKALVAAKGRRIVVM